MLRRSTLTAGVLISCAMAQSPATFRAESKLVEVDVVVRDRHGPAAGLAKKDFMVLDNGKPQEIAVFSIKFSSQPAQLSQRPAAPLPPGAVSNRVNRDGVAPGTTTILLMDWLNTEWNYQSYVNQKMVKFLETRRSQDWVGIYTLGASLKVVQELTGDPDLLRRAADSLKPKPVNHRTLYTPGPLEKTDPEMSGRALGEFTQMDAKEKVRGTEQALKAIARHLAQVPGRKNLVWITRAFPLFTPARRRSAGTPDFSPEMREAARALNDANVAVYPIDARGLCYACPGGWGLTVPGIDTMNLIAGLTGGQAHYADNGFDELVREDLADSDLTYMLGFYPSPESQDGQWHKLAVKVARSGVTARYRENYFAPTSQAAASERPTSDQLLNDSLDAAQIGLTAQAQADPARPGFFNVRVSLDLHDVQLDHQDKRWVGAVNVYFHADDSKTKRKITRKIEIPEDQLAASLEIGIVVQTPIEAGVSGSILRVVAQDTVTGAAGSVRVPLGSQQ